MANYKLVLNCQLRTEPKVYKVLIFIGSMKSLVPLCYYYDLLRHTGHLLLPQDPHCHLTEHRGMLSPAKLKVTCMMEMETGVRDVNGNCDGPRNIWKNKAYSLCKF